MVRFKSLLFIVASQVSVIFCARNATVFNRKLDIVVLIFDAPFEILKFQKVDEATGNLEQWIRDYSSDKLAKENVRFAFMPCFIRADKKYPIPNLYFSQSANMNAKEIIDSFVYRFTLYIGKNMSRVEDIGNNKHLGECAKTTKEEILDPQRGKRSDAKTVVLYVTDCKLGPNGPYDNTEAEMSDLLTDIEKFLFVCIESKSGGYDYSLQNKQAMLHLVNNDSRLIFNYSDVRSFNDKLTEILPTETILVKDCEVRNASSTECVFDAFSGTCTKVINLVVIVEPDPLLFAEKCLNTTHVTTSCDMNKCIPNFSLTSMKSVPYKPKASTEVMSLTESTTRENEEFSIESTTASSFSAKPSTKSTASASREPQGSTGLTAVLFVVFSCVILIAIATTAVCCGCKKKKKTAESKQRGNQVEMEKLQGKEKEKETVVDLDSTETVKSSKISRTEALQSPPTVKSQQASVDREAKSPIAKSFASAKFKKFKGTRMNASLKSISSKKSNKSKVTRIKAKGKTDKVVAPSFVKSFSHKSAKLPSGKTSKSFSGKIAKLPSGKSEKMPVVVKDEKTKEKSAKSVTEKASSKKS